VQHVRSVRRVAAEHHCCLLRPWKRARVPEQAGDSRGRGDVLRLLCRLPAAEEQR
ncbi:unnamed protein product, partial [Prorocentrum cordatum]